MVGTVHMLIEGEIAKLVVKRNQAFTEHIYGKQ